MTAFVTSSVDGDDELGSVIAYPTAAAIEMTIAAHGTSGSPALRTLGCEVSASSTDVP